MYEFCFSFSSLSEQGMNKCFIPKNVFDPQNFGMQILQGPQCVDMLNEVISHRSLNPADSSTEVFPFENRPSIITYDTSGFLVASLVV